MLERQRMGRDLHNAARVRVAAGACSNDPHRGISSTASDLGVGEISQVGGGLEKERSERCIVRAGDHVASRGLHIEEQGVWVGVDEGLGRRRLEGFRRALSDFGKESWERHDERLLQSEQPTDMQ